MALHVFIALPSTRETEKIKERMYFDKDSLDTTIFISGMYDKEDFEFIKRYPELFVQFYTFKSELRDRYGYFHILVECLRISMNIYEGCIKYILNKYGVLNIYENNIVELKELDRKVRLLNYDNDSEDKYYMFYEFVEDILEQEKDIVEDEYYKELFRFEKLLMMFKRNGKHEEKIFEFNIDIFKARNKNEVLFNKTIVKIMSNGKNNVHVSKIQSH